MRSKTCFPRLVPAAAGVLLLSWIGMAPRADAVVISGFDPARHSRFLSDGSLNPTFFIAEGQISGVASNPLVPQNGATLITPFHYLTASHAPETSPTFRGSDGVYHTYTPSSFVNLTTNLPGGGTSTSDLRLYRLASPIPVSDGVTPMALLDGDVANLIGKDFYVTGIDNRAGRNVVDDAVMVTFDGGASPSFAIQYSYDTATNGGTGGLGADEAGLIGGDSGHSALIQIGDQVALIGTHFGIDISMGQDPLMGDRYDSFSTLVTPYLDEIRTITMTDGFTISTLSITAVPEPSTLVTMTLVSLSAIAWNRRRAKNSRKTLTC